jgi:hypothetical protein
MTGMQHHAQLFPFRWSLMKFCPSWPGTIILWISLPNSLAWQVCAIAPRYWLWWGLVNYLPGLLLISSS